MPMITTKERIAMMEQVLKFMLILKTCKLFIILFDDEKISLFIKIMKFMT